MTNWERRLRQAEARFMPAPETAVDRELLRRLQVGRRRVQLDRQVHGTVEPVSEGLPFREHASRGIQQTIDILHEGRERNHHRWANEQEPHLVNSPATGADICR